MRIHAKQSSLPLPSSGKGLAARNGEAASLSIADLLGTILRHRLLIGTCVAASLLMAAVYLAMAKPIYEASASLRIDPSRASSLGLSDLLSTSNAGIAVDATATEVAILKSDTVAFATLASLAPEDFQSYARMRRGSFVSAGGAFVSNAGSEALLLRFKHALKVKQVEGTQLVAVSVRDGDPHLAAAMANGVVASYRKQSFDSRYQSVSQVSEWLSSEMGTLKDKASQAQQRLAAFQEKNNILGSDPSNNTTIDRLRLLNSRLAEAQSERIVKEAQMRASTVQEPAVLAALFPDANLNALRAHQGALSAQYAQLSAKFGVNYPPLAEVKQQMSRMDAELARSVNAARSSIREQYEAARGTEAMLQREYDNQTGRAYRLNREQAEYAVLRAEGASSRELYDTLQYKLQQAGVVAGLSGVNTMLVDDARAPLAPVEPRAPVTLGFGLAAGLLVGVGTSFFRETVSERAQSGEQLERIAGYPLLAVIPRSSGRATGRGRHELPGQHPGANLVTVREPQSRGAEAYRNLRSSFLLSANLSESKTVLITSTLAGEGKSNTAVNYAVVLAQKGARVLLIDGDLRRPSLHMHFGVLNRAGLTDLLLDCAAPDAFGQPLAGLERLYLLTAGRSVTLPSEALASERFRDLVRRWECEFDYLLIDSAPLLLVSDSLPLASLADSVLLVTRYNSTPMRAVSRARDVLARIDAHVAGVILNDVPGKAATYGDNGHGYYH